MRTDRAAAHARRIVSLAFRAFPREFRERYRTDALDYFEDRANDVIVRRGRIGLVPFVVRNVVDTVAAGLAERRSARAGALRLAGLADIRQAVRSLRRRPGFLASTAIPVALGVAGVTAVFAVIDSVLLDPLPYSESEALVAVGRRLPNGNFATLSTANLIDLEGSVPGLAVVGGITGGSVVLTGDDPAMVSVTRPTKRFMELFGVGTALGRPFLDEDFVQPQVAVLSWPYWQTRWGGDPSAIGSRIETDGGAYTIVGILPASWQPPEALTGSDGDVWIPLDYASPMIEVTRAFGFASGVGRIARGTSIEAVNEQLRAAATAQWRAHPGANSERDGTAKVLGAKPLLEQTVGDIGSRLALLLGAVVLLLVTACANVANLFLARGTERERELAMRSILGASRGRVVAQLVLESVAVALVGGAAGLLLATVSLDALVALTPDLPRADAVGVNPRVAAAAFAISLVSGVAFGLLPALTTSQRDPGRVLRGGSQPGRGADRLRGALVVGQTALALVLVAGGGLLVNSAVRLALVEPGFRPDGVLTIRPRLNPHVYGGAESPATPFFEAFVEALSGIPGVRSVSGTMFVPGQGLPLTLKVGDPVTGEPTTRWAHTVLPGFFDLLDIPIVEGRAIDESDRAGGTPSAVVSQSLAREMWPGESALGRTLSIDDGQQKRVLTVVGVAADIRNRGPHQPPEPVLYESFAQHPWLPSLDILVRHDGDAAALVPSIREALRSVDPTVPLTDVTPLPSILARNTVEARHYAILLGVFSLIALTIAGVGVYATVSYAVARRMREVGIRRAVGAGGVDVATLVLRRAMMEAGAGAAIGIALALAASRALEGLLFEITPSDPQTYAAVAAILLGSALLACVAPAARAVRADPLAILRAD